MSLFNSNTEMFELIEFLQEKIKEIDELKEFDIASANYKLGQIVLIEEIVVKVSEIYGERKK